MDTQVVRTYKTVEFAQSTYIPIWVEQFLVDRQASNKANGTLVFYRSKLNQFLDYCDSRAISQVDQLTPANIREYILSLETAGHNSGGIHAYYRTLRTFLRWYWEECEPVYKNPIDKVQAPKVELELLEPANIEVVNKILNTCHGKDFTSLRDRAIILLLMDTGLRANELTALDISDLDPIRGELLIRQGKGRKGRVVFIGKKTRKAIRVYITARSCSNPALFQTDEGERLAYEGLRQLVRRRSERAGAPQPTLHSFRRFFALSYLRNGGDVFTLQRLMGHADLQILRRYLNQCTGDLEKGHNQFGPVDNLKS